MVALMAWGCSLISVFHFANSVVSRSRCCATGRNGGVQPCTSESSASMEVSRFKERNRGPVCSGPAGYAYPDSDSKARYSNWYRKPHRSDGVGASGHWLLYALG